MWPLKKDNAILRGLNSQQSFFMGAGWGAALTSTLLLLVFMVVILGTNQVNLGGQVLGNDVALNDQPTQPPPPTQPTQPPPPPKADFSKISPVSDSDYIRGNKNAELTLIEYSDFQCPFCTRHNSTLDQILEEYKGQVRLVFRHLPLTSIHPQAQKAAEAAECAGEQGIINR